MKPIEYTGITKSKQPVWMHDSFANVNLVPGGARLKKESVTSTERYVFSGSLVGRTANGKQFHLIPANATKTSGNFVTKNATKTTVEAATGASTLTVANIDGFVVGDSIKVGSASHAIASINKINSTITLSAASAATAPAGTVVELATAVPYIEMFLTASEIPNVDSLDEFTQFRHGRMVYINCLPGYDTYSADVLATVKNLYQYIIKPA
jgi:hypothetical protein